MAADHATGVGRAGTTAGLPAASTLPWLRLGARAPWREAALWALAASTVVMWVAALVAVVMMEERDYIAVETLYPAASDPVEAGVPDAAIEEPLAQAA